MKKTTTNKPELTKTKLALRQEVIRELNVDELRNVVGGIWAATSIQSKCC